MFGWTSLMRVNCVGLSWVHFGSILGPFWAKVELSEVELAEVEHPPILGGILIVIWILMHLSGFNQHLEPVIPQNFVWGCIVTCPWRRSNKDCSAALRGLRSTVAAKPTPSFPGAPKAHSASFGRGTQGAVSLLTALPLLPPTPQASPYHLPWKVQDVCRTHHTHTHHTTHVLLRVRLLHKGPAGTGTSIWCHPLWTMKIRLTWNAGKLVARRQDVRTWSKMANFMNNHVFLHNMDFHRILITPATIFSWRT